MAASAEDDTNRRKFATLLLASYDATIRPMSEASVLVAVDWCLFNNQPASQHVITMCVLLKSKPSTQ